MNTSNSKTLLTPLAVLWLLTPAFAEPVSPAFTYQGQLTEGGVPADGLYDLVFQLYDAGFRSATGCPISYAQLRRIMKEFELTSGSPHTCAEEKSAPNNQEGLR